MNQSLAKAKKWPLSQSGLLEQEVKFSSSEAHVGRMDNHLNQDSGKKGKKVGNQQCLLY